MHPVMRNPTLRGLLLLIFLAGHGLAQISLTSPTTGWTPVSFIGSARSDYLNDEQTGINESDLVGSAVGVNPVQTAFYYDYDGTSNQIGFRVRLDGDSNPAGYTGAIWVGLMLGGMNGGNPTVDLFAGMINKGSVSRVGFYHPGTGANVSPSTTTIDNTNPIYSEAISAANYLFAPVTLGLAGNDPVSGGTNDVGGDGNTDHFATWVLPFGQLQAAAFARGFTNFTSGSTIGFVVGTSEQGNAMNQDLNGTSGNTTSTSTFASLGAVSPPITASGVIIPEPGTLAYVPLAFAALLLRRRI